MLKLITRAELDKLLTSLLNDFEVIGPKELAQKGIFYQPIQEIKDLYWGDNFAVEPIKKFFLSPSEYLYQARYAHKNEVLEKLSLSENKRIIIGVRPCEAKGLTLLDKVFGTDEYKDEFYLNNRRRTILVGLACVKPPISCFCTSLEGSPISNHGMDALLLPVGDDFILEIVSQDAEKIFNGIGSQLSEEKTKTFEADKERIKKALVYKIRVPESLDNIFENEYWSRVSRSCLSCGICTYLCPTCHCFDLVDEERKCLRCYDGCAFSDFTLEASGVNPRPTKKERYRQRVFHKFNYFKKNFGENLCVGCGRCIRHCPVKMDIAEIIANAPML